MLNRSFKIKIVNNPGTMQTLVYIYQEIPGKAGAVQLMQPMQMVVSEVKPGEDIKPTLTMNEYFAQDFLQSMAEALDEVHIKTDNDHKLRGTLEATRFHLDDLRQLLKLGGGTNGIQRQRQKRKKETEKG